jgi:hypothetical protein
MQATFVRTYRKAMSWHKRSNSWDNLLRSTKAASFCPSEEKKRDEAFFQEFDPEHPGMFHPPEVR